MSLFRRKEPEPSEESKDEKLLKEIQDRLHSLEQQQRTAYKKFHDGLLLLVDEAGQQGLNGNLIIADLEMMKIIVANSLIAYTAMREPMPKIMKDNNDISIQ